MEISPIQNIQEPTDISETLRQLNDDTFDPVTSMSGIDFRCRISTTELPSLLACDTLVTFNLLPKDCLNFTRQKKRLSSSILGEGRKEIVQISIGRREEEAGKSAFDKIKGIFGKYFKEAGLAESY